MKPNILDIVRALETPFFSRNWPYTHNVIDNALPPEIGWCQQHLTPGEWAYDVSWLGCQTRFAFANEKDYLFFLLNWGQ